MKQYIAAATVASGLLLSAGVSVASTLGLTTDTPSLSASLASIDYFDFGPDAELLTDLPEVDSLDGVSPNGFTTVDFVVGFSTLDPSDTSDFAFGGFFDVSDDDGQFLVGDLFAIGFSENVIELQFNNLSGSGAGSFGTSVLALIAFSDPLGANPFTSLFDGDSLAASITISNVQDVSVAPIPLPGGMPLLLAGLGGFALLRHRRRIQS